MCFFGTYLVFLLVDELHGNLAAVVDALGQTARGSYDSLRGGLIVGYRCLTGKLVGF
jgi:hypothetical protein